jgi:hypothetical protein
MGRFRSLLRLLLSISVSLCALLLLTLLASQVEQHVFRRRAELLLAQVQSIELRKTSWQTAQEQFSRWGANREFDEHCDSHKCSLKITLNESVFGYITQRNLFVKLDDYFRWRLKLSYSEGPFVRAEFWLLRSYIRLGGRPARVIANIGMRDGVVWGKGMSVWIETFGHPGEWSGNERVEFALFAEAHSVSRFDYYGDPTRATSQLGIHPNYTMGRPGGCTGCVEGWVKFTPYATREEVHRLMELKLSCLTQWHACVTQSDIMPTAWAEYVAYRSRPDTSEEMLKCPAAIEILGRDSANIAIGEVLRYRENFYSNGYDKIVATVHVLDRVKGMKTWNVDEIRDVTLLSGAPCAANKVRVGSRLIFYGGWDRSNEMEFNPQRPWPVIPMNDANMSLLRRGIDQDYRATDKSE